MTPREEGFLLLTSQLGNPNRKPLTVPQLRNLASRAKNMRRPSENRDLVPEDLVELGYSPEMAGRIVSLLSQQEELEYYLKKAGLTGCMPICRVSDAYPQALINKLGWESPGCLWFKGDPSLLDMPRIALVGSRDLNEDNRCFAEEAGRQAALQGYALVSGNARGADKTAQEACLSAGGCVISVVADRLDHHRDRERVLYMSEDDYDGVFTSQRALSRNRVIQCLADKLLVAQCTLHRGGTWDGTTKNLRFQWSKVFCFDDGSEASRELEQQGAALITMEELAKLDGLQNIFTHLFDQ